jgi:hypothetical protein
MRASEELLAMRELLAAPGAWTKWAEARTATGIVTSPNSSDAVCFCLRGAQHRLGMSEDACDYLHSAINKATGYPFWVDFNDAHNRTHLEVVEMIERAALAAMKAERGEG